ncbi:PucR family transcriptional regulator [Marinitenerispora sediminis]|uniref:Fis family transcriptional regulator n=1 Tax=Marinitenerispora sediminis TaxID=1931232 RepID=A0A368T2M8_9ACTN|nr:PucR family transcriptional regulator [Marinitenerispora sediminis]RCV51933.1 Fis family transcriptional regulator [Marinitenerispora sediminis]RCV53163.1 Fis family transcriptional regulator [Marinitenerispora sediminis]RCV56094.1 Fis family transcriptional regulator [Marinitenerispora sediminis]
MPPTLGAVLRTPRFRLRLLTDGARLDRPVRWVAVSELTDPTPYLEGGELLLTTGIRWAERAGTARDYVHRLVERGVAGLGFGVGVAHDKVPADLVEAATELGLPLVEVPASTAFVAIGKEVSRLLAKEEYEGLTRAFVAQRQLTQAALRGSDAVVDRLGAELGGWVLLFGPGGALRHAFPAEAAARGPALDTEVRRLRGSPHRASVSVSSGGENVAIQPLGVGGRLRGFLAVGSTHRLGPDERTLVNAAISLLSLELERSTPGSGAELRVGLLTALLDGAVDVGSRAARGLRAVLPAEPVVVAVAATDPEGSVVADPQLEGHLAAELAGRVVVLGSVADDPGETLARVTGGPVGVGEPTGYADLSTSRTQAERALESAQRGAARLVRHSDLPGGFLGLVDTPSGTRMADDLLAPLRDQRAANDLLASLRAFLATAGRWDAAAESLGIHRHTLRYRITRIRELLPGDLDDPDYRTELWLALRVLEKS